VYLIKYEGLWEDGISLYGFAILSINEWEKTTKLVSDYKGYPVIVTIGSNGEKICYNNSNEILKEYTTQIISYDRGIRIIHLFDNFQFGMFPILLVEETIKERKES